MIERYYVVIRYLVDDIDLGLVAGRCVNILHGVLLSKKNQYSGIGVSFPKWSNSSLGNEIAFVSYDRHALDYLIQQPYFEMMMNEKIFLISSVNTVPKELPEVSFRRNQNIAKCFTGEKRRRLQRAKRRAEERGEAFEPVKVHQSREVELFHSVFMNSKKSGQKFLLHIQRYSSPDIVFESYNSYGFSTNQSHQGTVPDLSSLT
ncbi:type I-F CRISPR-associated endoribonuclease Cas6/Csy4 [Photobacterium leiognathi]|uniref:type I-F CRISPR-associated endoribonuclease Cas6/Csy4 n=1 Tax=Photobacterium leiognathi TaxID=553611 RepID=UPI002733503B|nr:type I-F CRISPR-associated endoribonuclease Cas6/Csy4 [Photobacterium leiognathi]